MLRVSIISPERVLYEGETESLVAPGVDGQLGVLTAHAPMMTLLGRGELRLGAGADARRFARTEPFGRVVTNPPYGERLLEAREAAQLMSDFGRATRGLPTGWRVGIISGLEEFEHAFGRKADKRRKLYNGMLKCGFFQYGGPRPARPPQGKGKRR